MIADTDTLATLPAREYRSGLGEVAKYALIGAAERTRRLAELVDGATPRRFVGRDPDVLADLVSRCATIKAECRRA